MHCRLCFFLESARDPALFCDQITDIIRMDKRQIHFLRKRSLQRKDLSALQFFLFAERKAFHPRQHPHIKSLF